MYVTGCPGVALPPFRLSDTVTDRSADGTVATSVALLLPGFGSVFFTAVTVPLVGRPPAGGDVGAVIIAVMGFAVPTVSVGLLQV